MSKSGFSSGKVMKQYFSALLTEESEVVSKPNASVDVIEKPKINTKELTVPVSPTKANTVKQLLQKAETVKEEPVVVAKKAVTEVIEPPKKVIVPTPAIINESDLELPELMVSEKSYHQGGFQALFFEVAGLTLAVPLTELGGIHSMTKLNNMVGKPKWFKGVMLYREQTLNVIDTAKWVMPEKITSTIEESVHYKYLIMLKDSPWGLACEKLINTAALEQDEVKWSNNQARRPWLAGLIKERMCALLDVDSLIHLFDRGQSSTN